MRVVVKINQVNPGDIYIYTYNIHVYSKNNAKTCKNYDLEFFNSLYNHLLGMGILSKLLLLGHWLARKETSKTNNHVEECWKEASLKEAQRAN